MARRIVVTSGKGGVGKTTFCANIGVSLAGLGAKVCLIDLDMGLNNLDVAMGIENKVIYDLVDVAQSKCRVSQALVQDSVYSTLYTLPTSQSFARQNVTLDKLKSIIEMLNDAFDFVLIDCPAGIDDGFYKCASLANEAIVMATPHIFSIRDADKVLRVLLTFKLHKINLVMNRIREDLIGEGEMLSPQKASEILHCKLLGIVPEDDIFASSTIAKYAHKQNDAKKAFDLIAKNLLGGTNELFELKKNKNRFINFCSVIFKNKKAN